MFDHTQVDAALDFMQRYGLTSLIFHKNDLLDDLVFPEKYYPMQYMWDRFGPRYSRTLNYRYYINNVIDKCHQRGLKFIAEVKEISFDEWIVELHPEVRNPETGRLCPSHPFWWEYLSAKMDELLENVPGLDGVIVSSGTLESKLSISANKCGCEKCGNSDDVAWNARLLEIMHGKLAEKGKFLVVRDFCFSAKDQTTILQAVDRASSDIKIAMKNTPHDYYPTFPTNPAIGHSGHEEWIEFDTWGQFFGNGIFPVSIVEDMKERMRECFALGAKGIWLRTDWENMSDHCVFNSPNMLNLIAGAMLSGNIDTDAEEIYREWGRFGLLSPLKPASYDQKPVPVTDPDGCKKLRDFMRASWEVIKKTVFVQDHLFQDNSMFPYSMERCFYIMLKIHSMDEWKPGSSRRVTPTEKNLERIFAEKTQAIAEAEKLGEILQVRSLGLPEDMAADFEEMLDIYKYYVRCFYLSAQACFRCQKTEMTKSAADKALTLDVLKEIEKYKKAVRERARLRTYTHEIGRLIDDKRFDYLIRNIREHLDRIDVR
jgi:hypothetical protein